MRILAGTRGWGGLLPLAPQSRQGRHPVCTLLEEPQGARLLLFLFFASGGLGVGEGRLPCGVERAPQRASPTATTASPPTQTPHTSPKEEGKVWGGGWLTKRRSRSSVCFAWVGRVSQPGPGCGREKAPPGLRPKNKIDRERARVCGVRGTHPAPMPTAKHVGGGGTPLSHPPLSRLFPGHALVCVASLPSRPFSNCVARPLRGSSCVGGHGCGLVTSKKHTHGQPSPPTPPIPTPRPTRHIPTAPLVQGGPVGGSARCPSCLFPPPVLLFRDSYTHSKPKPTGRPQALLAAPGPPTTQEWWTA